MTAAEKFLHAVEEAAQAIESEADDIEEFDEFDASSIRRILSDLRWHCVAFERQLRKAVPA